MDKDRIAGSANQAKGAVKEAVGKATGDEKLKAEGAADKAAGKVQNATPRGAELAEIVMGRPASRGPFLLPLRSVVRRAGRIA